MLMYGYYIYIIMNKMIRM